jgi:hypothetical protein
MRDVLWPVEDLGPVAASAASAATAALEYHCNRLGERPTKLSSLFVHYNARLGTGQQGVDAGTTLEAALRAITTYGACREVTWPFDPAKVTAQPPASAYEEAKRFAAVECFNPGDLMEALALRYPVPFVAQLPERCLQEAGRTGVMPAPTTEERQRADTLSNHAFVAVGYDKAARTVLARNCWGKQWGQQGHCTISFEIMSLIAPYGSPRVWVLARPGAAVPGHTGAIHERTVTTPAPPPAPTPAPPPAERLADLASKMREEIRGNLQRDLSEATKRIRDMVGRTPGAAPPQAQASICPACSGSGKCNRCRDGSCGSCSYGTCGRCGGSGMA